ncbi:hypothetical protein KUW19_00725 [Ferrimonas balearica]|uniref:hypothetical protein n=1 Tax=Ferrimonas balearica TaxID=44012 RepID=UPI001C9779CD|nr:hypothetical protein [Ferrimonas balearica]MBY6105000.1 hypothetical protein [Ferrimonas balearica]
MLEGFGTKAEMPWQAKAKRAAEVAKTAEVLLAEELNKVPVAEAQVASSPAQSVEDILPPDSQLVEGNPFAYARVGEFLRKIADGNEYLLRAAELLPKPKERWETLCVKFDKEVFETRQYRHDDVLLNFLRKADLALVKQYAEIAPKVYKERQSEEAKSILKAKTAELDTKLSELASLGVPKETISQARTDALAKIRAELGLGSVPLQALKPLEAKTPSKRLKNERAQGRSRLVRHSNPDWPYWAMEELDESAPFCRRVQLVCHIDGHAFYTNSKGRLPLPFQYAQKLGQTEKDWYPKDSDPQWYDSKAQSNFLAVVRGGRELVIKMRSVL